MLLREVREADLAPFADLIASNECLCSLGRAHGNEEWSRIGSAYVANVLRTELSSWEACSSKYQSAAGSKLWVLEVSPGRLAGSIGAIPSPEDSTVELVRMYVDSSVRRKGHGRRLVEVLLGYALSIKATRVKLTTPTVNAPGISFYESLGFCIVREFTVDSNGSPLDIAELELHMPPLASTTDSNA